MSKIVHVLSQIPELAKLTARALPNCQVINVELRQYTGIPSRELKIDDRELADLNSAEILFGDPNLLVQTFKLPNIKWIQSTWAGIDLLLKFISETGEKPPQCPITRFSGESFGQLIFDYCIAHIIMHERKLFNNYVDTKINKVWQSDVVWDYRSINEITIAILGTGAIGSLVAKKFTLLGTKVIGYGRTESCNKSSLQDIPLAKYSTKLEDILPECDYIISVLPSTPQTKGLLNNDILKICNENSPVLINVGRGSLISESEIVKALDNKWISTAILDVFETEPLPETSLLWSHPNVFITPHNAAISRANDCVKLFVENYKNYVAKQPLLYTIDWNCGY